MLTLKFTKFVTPPSLHTQKKMYAKEFTPVAFHHDKNFRYFYLQISRKNAWLSHVTSRRNEKGGIGGKRNEGHKHPPTHILIVSVAIFSTHLN